MTRSALVTGGSSGLGKAMVARLITAGVRVVCVDRRPPEPEEGLVFVECDLADRTALTAALPAILAGGPYDIVILNAGISATGPFERIPEEACRRVVAVNTEAPIRLAAALMRETALSANGHMVFVSSLSHFTGYPGAAVYAASKDALAVYARSVRPALAASGVSVTCVYPGPLRTEHAARHAPREAAEAARMDPGEAAHEILTRMLKRRRDVVPGGRARLIALVGRCFPGQATRWMRRLVFERLEGTVY